MPHRENMPAQGRRGWRTVWWVQFLFLVQMLEIVIKKTSPGLYAALGVYLPLITTNCAVLGVAILAAQRDFGLVHLDSGDRRVPSLCRNVFLSSS